jgi:membrane protein implicated in regulation of membrane protease activity
MEYLIALMSKTVSELTVGDVYILGVPFLLLMALTLWLWIKALSRTPPRCIRLSTSTKIPNPFLTQPGE